MNNNEDQDYNSFKTWLLNLDFDDWKSIFQDKDIDQLQLHEHYENLQKKFGNLSEFSHSMNFSVEGDPLDSEIKPEELSIVKVGDEFWLTTFDYEKFWELSGDNVETLQYIDRQVQAVIVDAFSDDRRSVMIGVY